MHRSRLFLAVVLASVEFVSCGGGPTAEAPITRPVAALSASSLAFGNQSVNTTSAGKSLTLTNIGNAALAISSITSTGDFGQTNTCGSSVAASANCVITVTFTPTGSGVRTGLITIADNASSQREEINLSGTGTAPAVQLSAASLIFSAQVEGTTSPAQTVTLTNTGNEALTISSITSDSNFAQTNSCGAAVAASAGCSISVTFTPSAGGPSTGMIHIADNAPGSPQTVALNGIGMAGLLKLSTDTFTNTTSQHATEVEPDTVAAGSKIVSVFQAGRFFDGGASAIGFATSTDGGSTWTSGFLTGITKVQDAANPYDRVSDPAVAFDSAHGVWLIETLPVLSTGGIVAPAVLVSRSADGINWESPIAVTNGGDFDKPWITCDNWPQSPFFGNCYVEWDNPGVDDQIQMSTSSDGGLTWGPALETADGASGIGGQPVVQPNGTVVVPIADAFETNILEFASTDGGASWSSTKTVSPIADHSVAGGLRYGPLPSAQVDASGKVYVVWPDCSFRTSCSSNDIVMITSTDGVTWTPSARIPIDPLASGADHFIPSIAVDPATSGSSAHLGVIYYYYPLANCTPSTCELDVGFIASQDSGTTWAAPTQLAGPMNLSSLPLTNIGLMVGDYISAAYVNGLSHGAFAVANPAAGAVFDEAIYTTVGGHSESKAARKLSSAGETPVRHARSDHFPRRTPAKVR